MSLKANIVKQRIQKKRKRRGHGAGEENTLLRYMGTCTMMLLIILMSPHIYVFAFIQLPFFCSTISTKNSKEYTQALFNK